MKPQIQKANPQQKPNQKKRGQGMTEYIIVVALIAIATIGIITLFGNNIRELFADSAQALAGQTSVSNSGNSNPPTRLRGKNMENFGQNNAP